MAKRASGESASKRRERFQRAINGRNNPNQSLTSGARSADFGADNPETMREAWAKGLKVQTYTSTPSGQLSVNGKNTQGAKTWALTPKNDDGSSVIKNGRVRQSGRSQIATRRQRDYDNRKAMNNISPRVIQAWLDNGMARMVDGSMVGANGHVIRQKADGNYSMGLTTG